MTNLDKISVYTKFRVTAAYHNTAQLVAITEAIRLWLEKYKWEDKRPRALEERKEK